MKVAGITVRMWSVHSSHVEVKVARIAVRMWSVHAGMKCPKDFMLIMCICKASECRVCTVVSFHTPNKCHAACWNCGWMSMMQQPRTRDLDIRQSVESLLCAEQ